MKSFYNDKYLYNSRFYLNKQNFEEQELDSVLKKVPDIRHGYDGLGMICWNGRHVFFEGKENQITLYYYVVYSCFAEHSASERICPVFIPASPDENALRSASEEIEIVQYRDLTHPGIIAPTKRFTKKSPSTGEFILGTLESLEQLLLKYSKNTKNNVLADVNREDIQKLHTMDASENVPSLSPPNQRTTMPQTKPETRPANEQGNSNDKGNRFPETHASPVVNVVPQQRPGGFYETTVPYGNNHYVDYERGAYHTTYGIRQAPKNRISPNCTRIILSDLSFRKILAETSEHSPNETGGVFMGNFDSGIWYVVDCVDPGLNTTNRRTIFEYDTDYVNHLIKKQSRLYAYPTTVLGIWHRHPGNMDYFSPNDYQSMSQLVNESKYGLVFMLVNCDPEFRMTFYYLDKKKDLYYVPFNVGDEYMLQDFMALAPAKNLSYDSRGAVPIKAFDRPDSTGFPKKLEELRSSARKAAKDAINRKGN